jgi:thiamine-phosphate pyrophosphorylase
MALLGISPGRGLAALAALRASLEAGLPRLILREPGISAEELESLIRALPPEALVLHARHPAAVPLSRRWALDLHLPADSPDQPGAAGRSCHSRAALEQAAREGRTYALLSPIYAPGSKPGDRRPTLGLAGLTAACAGLRLPVYALGGIFPHCVPACLAAGAAGVAVLGGLFDPQVADPAAATRAYLDQLRSA